MFLRASHLLAILLSLTAVQVGVPVTAGPGAPFAQEEQSTDEVNAAEEGAPLRSSARRTTRLAALAQRQLPPPSGDTGLAVGRLQVPAVPRFRDVRHLVPRFGE
jgi:hypothetical protein